MYVCVYVCISILVDVWLCDFISNKKVCVYMYVWLSVCRCVCIRMTVCMYVCMYVLVRCTPLCGFDTLHSFTFARSSFPCPLSSPNSPLSLYLRLRTPLAIVHSLIFLASSLLSSPLIYSSPLSFPLRSSHFPLMSSPSLSFPNCTLYLVPCTL